MKYLTLLIFSALAFVLQAQDVPSPASLNNLQDALGANLENTTQSEEKAIPAPVNSQPSVAYVPKHALKKFNQRDSDTALDEEVEKLYRQAYQEQLKGSYNVAIRTYHKIIKKKPKYERARISLAQVLAIKGDYAGILSTLTPLTDNNDSHWSVWYWMGVAFMKQGAYQLSIQATEEALSRNVENADLWLLRALIEQETDDHQSALQLLSAADQLSPNHPNILLNKAISNEAIGQTNLALINYSKYLKLVQGTTNRALPNNIVLDRIARLRTVR